MRLGEALALLAYLGVSLGVLVSLCLYAKTHMVDYLILACTGINILVVWGECGGEG